MFSEMKLSRSNTKNENENPEQFDIFQETETLKKLLISQEVPWKP